MSSFACADVCTVKVTVCAPPLAAMLAGEKVAVAPAGKPVAVKLTVPGYVPPVGASEKLNVAVPPGAMLWLEEDPPDVPREKSEGGAWPTIKLVVAVAAA